MGVTWGRAALAGVVAGAAGYLWGRRNNEQLAPRAATRAPLPVSPSEYENLEPQQGCERRETDIADREHRGPELKDAANPSVQKRSLFRKLAAATAPIVLFSAIAAFALWKSGHLVPAPEDYSTMPGNFTIQVPSILVGDVEVPPKLVRYNEAHRPNEVLLSISIEFDQQKTLASRGWTSCGCGLEDIDDHAEIHVPLPQSGAEITSCNETSKNADCTILRSETSTGKDYVIVKFHTGKVENYLNASVGLTGIAGAGMKTTESRAQIRLPSYFPATRAMMVIEDPTAPKPSADAPLDVDASYTIPDADRYSWGGSSPEIEWSTTNIFEPTDSAPRTMASWRYPNGGTNANVTGIRDDIIDRNSRDTFKAGIWLGIGGAAVIAALQVLVVAPGIIRAED